MSEIIWKSQEEMDEEKNKPKPPGMEERIAGVESAVTDLLIKKMMGL
jgi:hypothetical protein